MNYYVLWQLCYGSMLSIYYVHVQMTKTEFVWNQYQDKVTISMTTSMPVSLKWVHKSVYIHFITKITTILQDTSNKALFIATQGWLSWSNLHYLFQLRAGCMNSFSKHATLKLWLTILCTACEIFCYVRSSAQHCGGFLEDGVAGEVSCHCDDHSSQWGRQDQVSPVLPNTGMETFGPFEVTLTEQQILADYTIRKLTVKV